jgi:hypothetical protein
MLLTTAIPGLRLADDQVARLTRAAGTRLESQEGLLWITQDGELDDRILEPGQSWTVPSQADVVVSAFRGDATLVLRAAGGGTPCASIAVQQNDDGRRLQRWFSRLAVPLGDVL